jgi:hypothetical protein
MSDMEKAKRKAKPHQRISWRRVIVRAITIVLTLLVVSFAFILVFPACGCSPGTFSRDSTEIKATNDAVAVLLEQTNVAATKNASLMLTATQLYCQMSFTGRNAVILTFCDTPTPQEN